MRSSLRNRLLGLFLVLVIIIGAGTLFAIEHTLAEDLLVQLDARLTTQGAAVASWLITADHPERLAPQLAQVMGARITIVAADGTVEVDSREPAKDGDAEQYVVAVPFEQGRVIRLAVPLGEIQDARTRMRHRLLVGFGFGFLGALLLSWVFVRAITRPIQSITRTAEQLAAGKYDGVAPTAATEAGGELGVLARAMMRMAGEVKTRVGELTQQRDLLSVVFAGLVEGVVVVDRAGDVVLANDASRPMVGDGPLPAPLAKLVERALAGAQADGELELFGRTVRVSARPLASPSSAEHAAAAIVVLYDVTRMRALESVRREFLSNAAHELRTPVTSISGYAETLLGGGVDADTSREFLTTIHRNAQRIAGLVSDLLVLDQLGSRAETVGERAAVALAPVVDDAARTTRGVAPQAQIDAEVPAKLAVLGTRDGLDHVVQNLIDNAVKYGGGTPIVVRAERVERRVRLSVADSGPGIPIGNEERVFERFFRIDSGRSRDRGGSGLGLAIVKSQVEAMGGRVWVEHANPGARFVIELDGE